MKMKLLKITFVFSLCFIIGFAAPPVKMTIQLGGQAQNSQFRAASGRGYAAAAELAYEAGNNIDLFLNVAYDRIMLDEDSVVLEWDWPYWDERYIDWLLTGATQEEVDSISSVLEYWRPDSSYHGVFNPYQWMNEIRISAGASYHIPLAEKVTLYGSMGGGLSIYERRLKMVEDWTKVFTWEWDSLAIANESYSENEMENYDRFMDLVNTDPITYQLDTLDGDYSLVYHYETTVTHFAPNKTGLTFFLTPKAGIRYDLNDVVDLNLGYQGIFYLHVNDAVEKTDFPVKSKSMVWLGLTFKY